jgi:S-DNA-T family DNA segregation ATPase FtsK/SpoIIIE
VKNDIVGLLISFIGIILLVIVILPGEAIASRLLNDAVRLLVGLGAFVLPFMLMAWGVTFFVRRRVAYAPLRLVFGLLLIFVAVVTLLGTATPHAASDPLRIFDLECLKAQGGYLGGFFAWAGMSLFGQIATVLVFVAVIIAGLVLIGFSISGLVERGAALLARRREEKASGTQANSGAAGAAGVPGAQGAYQMAPTAPTLSMDGTFAPTRLRRSRAEEAGAAYDDAAYDDAFEDGPQGRLPLDATVELGSTRRNKAAASLKVIDGGNGNVDDGSDDGDAGSNSATPRKKGLPRAFGLAGASASPAAQKAGSPPPTAVLSVPDDFKLPDAKVLRVSREKATTKAGISELKATATRLQATLEEFGVDGEVIGWTAGPTVTLYKVSLGEGVRLNRITNLQDDIQLSLAALAIRIVAPIPGTSLVGIEIPNDTRNTVLLGDVLSATQAGPLQLAIGKDVEGDCITADLATMPHLLIGGTTGSGKSVAINAIIMSILMRATPSEVRMILVDPKRVELTLYNGIPHLYVPVVTDAQQAAGALAWAVVEMERRLKVFEKHGVKNIRQFNSKVAEELERRAKEEEEEKKRLALAAEEEARKAAASDHGELDADGSDAGGPAGSAGDAGDPADEAGAAEATGSSSSARDNVATAQDELSATMPYLVIVIDELADLMMVAGKDVESSISRLAQLARAAGLHLIVATQRPSTNVITGLIKANIVNRIAFTVASGIDSRVILDAPGAEKLIGLGDLLFGRPEYNKPMRIQGCYVSEPEIETVVDFLRSQGEPDYHEDILMVGMGPMGAQSGYGADDLGDDDPLVWEAADIVVSSGLGSTSTLQRRLKVGYARAGRIMDMLEAKGVVGPPNGSKPREVLLDDVLDLETLKAFESR